MLAFFQQGTARGQAADSSDENSYRAVASVANRTETPLDETPARVQVITRRQIEQSGARDAGELLQEQPGVVVSQGFRGDSVQLGGLDPEYTLVLVDGERVPGRIGGAIDLGRFGAESIERIEVLRGPGSALYGADAIAGVINIVTRAPRSGVHTDGMASYGYGSGHIFDASASASGATGPVYGRVGFGYHFADPVFREVSDVASSGSGRNQLSTDGRIEWRPSPHLRLDVRGEYMKRELSGIDANDAGAVFDRIQLAEQGRVSLGSLYRRGRNTQVLTRFAYSIFREQFLLDQRGSSALDDVQDNREHMAQFTMQLDHRAGDHRLTLGLESLYQTLASERLVGSGIRAGYSPFVQDEWTIADAATRWVAVAGTRLDVNTQFGTQLSPRVGLRFEPVPDVVIVRATYGWGFRAPSFQELLLRFENPSVGYIVSGNPNLDPERSRGLDVGVEWKTTAHLQLSAYFYRNDLTNMIAIISSSDGAAGTRFTYGNIARAYTQGADFTVRVKPWNPLSIQLTYGLLDTRDVEANRPLEGRAMHRWTLLANLQHPGTGISAMVRTALLGTRVFFDDNNGDGVEEEVRTNPALQTDLRVGKKLFTYFEAFLGIDNVFDVGDAYLFVRPRTFYVGMRGHY